VERLFRIDDVTNCGDFSSNVAYLCDSKVGKKLLGTIYSITCCNFKTKQMLNIEYFKLKHGAKVSCQTGSALNRHENTLLYGSRCTKNMWKGLNNLENCPNMRLELLTAKLLNWRCSCIVDVHVYDVKINVTMKVLLDE